MTALTSTCRFRVAGPTGGWRTVSLDFSRTAGAAFSRDFLAALGDRRGAVEGTIRRGPAPALPASPGVAGVRVTIDGPGAPVSAVTNVDGYYHALLPEARPVQGHPQRTAEPFTPARRVVAVNGSTALADFVVRPPCTPVAPQPGGSVEQQLPECGPPIASFARTTSRNPRDVSWDPSGSSDPGGRIVA